MQNTISPSQAEQYGISREDYHAILMTANLHNGRILQILSRTPYEMYIVVEGLLSEKLQLSAKMAIKIIHHDDGIHTDYICGPLESLSSKGASIQ